MKDRDEAFYTQWAEKLLRVAAELTLGERECSDEQVARLATELKAFVRVCGCAGR